MSLRKSLIMNIRVSIYEFKWNFEFKYESVYEYQYENELQD